ncbi:DNA-binding transcriptional regulator, LysR family [Paenibacillus sp. UNCCL117]|uniref:LysR family transcriptional regulator n=1 Tax=unclassified Paenibacillus TaxID=185978 RepID=UPI00088B1B98|nr:MULTISPECIES: LysR family transcriptional regulator [unclassified Paenibacillus]SDD33107.1 DNA-binding transcriptional regulator, LysR family [Paenibacillus sp. cl123]SFW39654.1 DNA-binding transcriptional regulator, LysR family [Paenibacillus sp. UNCCL117]
MMNLEWYRIFLQTARHGNLTKAAQELHITQPSVSYALKQMEQSLGIKLFNRLSKGVELTQEGRALLGYVEQSFSLLDAAQEHVQKLKQLTEGELRIGASESLIKHLLLPKLDLFHVKYPGIRIRLSHGRTPDLAKRLKEGHIDCAIVHMPLIDPQLVIRPLAKLEECFVVGEAHRELTAGSLSMEELVGLPLLFLSPGSSTRFFVEQWFAAKGYTVKPDIELGSIDLLAEFARRGYGAAFITRSFVEAELQNGMLYELQLEEPVPPRSIGFAIRREVQLSMPADRFARLLMDMEEHWKNAGSD